MEYTIITWSCLTDSKTFYFLGNRGIKCFMLGEIWSYDWRHGCDLRKSCRGNSHVIVHCLLLLLFSKTSTNSKTNRRCTVFLRYIERVSRLCRIGSIIWKKYAWCTCIRNMHRIFRIPLSNRDACDPHQINKYFAVLYDPCQLLSDSAMVDVWGYPWWLLHQNTKSLGLVPF